MRKILFVFLMVVLSLLGCQSNESSALVQSSESSLGQKLVFPSGYHLVSFAIYNTDATLKTVYICQSDTEASDYRICIPETKQVGR